MRPTMLAMGDRQWIGRARPLAIVIALVGCGPVREELPLQQLCVLGYAGQGEETFRSNERVRLSLGVDVLRTCRPLCDSLVSSRCSLTRDGNTFRLTGSLVVDVEHGCKGSSLPACSAPTVECLTDPLPPGDYAATDGTRTVQFRVPSTVTDPIRCAR
jgi:hypothetical protein